MKGDERVVKKLDELLSDELTAIMQYVVHSEMCANWGYQRLHQAVEKRARQEMHHAEKLIARIIFLEGTPNGQPAEPDSHRPGRAEATSIGQGSGVAYEQHVQ